MARLTNAIAICLLLTLPFAAAPSGAQEQEPMMVRVTPAFARSPATLRIEVLVAPDEENRALLIGLDSADYYRSSSIALAGADAARFHSVVYASVPEGVYRVYVQLQTAQG